MSSSFVQRRLRATILVPTSGTGTTQALFAGAGGKVVLPELRMSCRIQNAGAPSQQTAQLSVFGMSESLMKKISTLGITATFIPRNAITIEASLPNGGFTTVFGGSILNAWADYGSAPDVPMRFECVFGAVFNVVPEASLSYTGPTDVAQIMQDIANKMELALENNDVSVILKNPILAGSLIQQMQQAARDANIDANVINGKTLVIAPKNKARATANAPLVVVAPPPLGQMIGYPTPTPNGVSVSTIFDARIGFKQMIEVHSSIIKTQNSQNTTFGPQQFRVDVLNHALDSQVPRGQWMSTIFGYSPNLLTPNILPR